jgi:hypothetical protein
MLARGDTFYYSNEGSTRHLHIVLCGSEKDEKLPLIVVPVNTLQDWTDKTVILQVGDHPFITRPSSVSYNWTRSFPISLLRQLEEASQRTAPGFRSFDHEVPVPDELLERITEGALTSRMTPKAMKRAIRERLGILPPDPRCQPS